MANETMHYLRHGFVAQQTENGGWVVRDRPDNPNYEMRVTKAFSSDADFVRFIMDELGDPVKNEHSKEVRAALEALEAGPIEAPYIGHTTGE